MISENLVELKEEKTKVRWDVTGAEGEGGRMGALRGRRDVGEHRLRGGTLLLPPGLSRPLCPLPPSPASDSALPGGGALRDDSLRWPGGPSSSGSTPLSPSLLDRLV